MAKNQLVDSFFMPGGSIICTERAKRSGLSPELEKDIEDNLELLLAEPVSCETQEWQGLPFPHPHCVFTPRNEQLTTAEWAAVNPFGEFIYHEQPKWPRTIPWELAVIDNKYPLLDIVKLFTGESYSVEIRDKDSFVPKIDAKGKDLVVLLSPSHLVSPLHIDYNALTQLEQHLTKRLLQEEDTKYVVLRQNGAGFPVINKKSPYLHVIRKLMQDLPNLENIIGWTADQEVTSGIISDILSKYERYSKGIYETEGGKSGNSQVHPHSRIVSIPKLPKLVEWSYQKQQETARKMNEQSIYGALLHGDEYIIKNESNIALIVDPAPVYDGTILIVAKDAPNITKMSEEDIRELAEKRLIAQCLVDITFGHKPYNVFTFQTFGDYIDKFPESRYLQIIAPRTNIHAFFELATGINCTTEDPLNLAKLYREVLTKYIEPQLQQISQKQKNLVTV